MRAAEGYGFGKKDHTQAVRLFQAELNTAKLPFTFVQALFRWPSDDPATLRLACAVLKRSGADFQELRRVLG